MFLLRSCCAVLVAGAAVVAQIPPGHAVVATRTTGRVATVLLDVDLATGGVTQLGRFSEDGFAPLAVAVDPVNGDVVLVVDIGGSSLLVRLTYTGAVLSDHRLLAPFGGLVTSLHVAGDGSLFATVDGAAGGVMTVPRNGGTPTWVVRLPRLAAMAALGLGQSFAWVAQSGSAGAAGRDPQVMPIDLVSRRVGVPVRYAGFRPRQLTGIVDLSTGASRQIVSDVSGRLSISVGFGAPTTIPVTPVLPPGGAVAMRFDPELTAPRVLVLGGASHPYLQQLGNYFGTATSWTKLAGPLLGDPVDFALAAPPVARVDVFGVGCAPARPTFLTASEPRLGNAMFAVSLFQGIGATGAVLSLGTSERSYSGVPLPVALPGGCPLAVSIVVSLATMTDVSGRATVSLPIPNQPGLSGATFFVQWLQFAGSFATSPAGAVHVFR